MNTTAGGFNDDYVCAHILPAANRVEKLSRGGAVVAKAVALFANAFHNSQNNQIRTYS